MAKASVLRKRSVSGRRAGAASELAFTVDAALFRELGERLVGKPHIALAELIKNAYDADATEVRVTFGKNRIDVSDNGSGMTFDEFKRFWMRVGSPHKQDERVSPRYGRGMTGSKGVGRLAAQFLANELEIRTRSRARGSDEIRAEVDWTEAIRAGDLTQATARFTRSRATSAYPSESGHGTIISLTGLQHRWTDAELVELAREIWWLQPPFNPNPRSKEDVRNAFKIVLEHTAQRAARDFDEQMRAALDLWYARITGRITRSSKGTVHVSVDLVFDDGQKAKAAFDLADGALSQGDFELRVFSLSNRQAKGIKVETAREYLKQFGGVHVYDADFHLPYYGPDTDWLRIEMDHSHRLSKSALLPPSLQVANGMNNLPTQSRILGAVHVDTAAEHAAGSRAHRRDYLKIQVSRDRLVDNQAFDQLRAAVRWALDYYAMEETRRKLRAADRQRPKEPSGKKLSRVERVLLENRERMPKQLFNSLHAGLSDAVQASSAETKATSRSMGLLGALATAGMVSIAYEKEIQGQFQGLDEMVSQLEDLSRSGRLDRGKLTTVSAALRSWARRARATRELFGHLASPETRENASRYKARSFIEDARDQIEPLMGKARVDVSGVSASERLPLGTYAEWSALFQNVLLNAANAVSGTKEKDVMVASRVQGRARRIVVQDTGVGIDLRDSARLFEPFEQASAKANGSRPGGAGLGLTIVKMLAVDLGCRVAFVQPDEGFRTAFELSWDEA